MKVWMRKLMGKIRHCWSGGTWWSWRFPCNRLVARFLYWQTLNMAKHSENYRKHFFEDFFLFLAERFDDGWNRLDQKTNFFLLYLRKVLLLLRELLKAGNQMAFRSFRQNDATHREVLKLASLQSLQDDVQKSRRRQERQAEAVKFWEVKLSLQLGWVNWGTFRCSRRSSRHRDKF